MKTSRATALAELADELGVQTSYQDAFGTVSGPSPDALVHVLRALGAELADAGDADAALRQVRTDRARQVIEPVVVVWDGATADVAIGPASGSPLTCHIELESGEALQLPSRDADTTVTLPPGLAAGYHRLVVERGGTRHVALIISAPSLGSQPARLQRAWGVFAPLYAVRSRDSWGVGDLGDAAVLADTVAGRGGALVGSTPLLPTFLDELFEPSPYSPVSRLAWNELYLDIAAVPEARLGSAASLIGSAAVRTERDRLSSLDLVDYRAVAALRRRVLEAAVAELAPGSARERSLDTWLAAHPRIADYARFRAASERAGTPFPQWPDSARAGAPDADPAAVRYHEFVQWNMDAQLRDLASGDGAGLYLDLPVGVHPHGYDAWRFADRFAAGVAVGAPPDPLGPDGQNWGLPPLLPQASRERGHDYVIECVQHLFRHADAVRIDHVMGLHRLFWIPDGMPASEGAFVSCPHDELWAIVCLESHRHDVLLVGEDLGTVPDAVRESMQRHGATRSYVLEFSQTDDPRRPLTLPEPGMLATVDTHDTETIVAFWERQGEPEQAAIIGMLRAFGALAADDAGAPSTVDVIGALHVLLAGSDAQVVIASLEALWGESDPQNVPGVGHADHPNWRRRFDLDLEQIAASPSITDTLERIDAARTAAHRPAATTTTADVPPVVHVTREQSLVTDTDLYLLDEGTHHSLQRCLGSHVCEVDGRPGVMFAVWAPSARAVSVIGDFNWWKHGAAPLAPLGSSGIWEGFLPGLAAGATYKYAIESQHAGRRVEKADPIAVRAEVAPRTASIVHDLAYEWGDDGWMADRGRRNALDAPMSVYEVHLGSWMRVPEEDGRSLTYREIAPRLIEHVQRLGFTHVELMPLTEHPFYGSWGYQTTGYFAATSRYGTPQDLKHLIDQLHQAGIGVILDWVPSHFPTDEFALGCFDGTHLYEHADPRQGFHPDWKSYIFNYSRSEVRSFLLSSAMFWLTEYHVDALRVDAVASMLYLDYSRAEGEWIPNINGGRENLEAISLLQRINEDVYGAVPGVQTIAEESTSWGGVSRPTSSGGLGFGMKWDMGWMHDTLQHFGRDPIHRRWHQDELTFRALYAATENFMLPLSHDEVVHGKGSIIARMPGDEWQQFANLRLLYSYMYALPGKKLLFMGCELAQRAEWNHESSLDWHLLDHAPHRGIMQTVTELNRLHREHPALHELDCEAEGFEWVVTDAESGVLGFLRHDRRRERPVLVVINTTPAVHDGYVVGVPRAGVWEELFNGDASQLGGSGVGNSGGVEAQTEEAHGHAWSLRLTLPPLGALMLGVKP